MGKLWDKIKELLFGKKNQMLPPGEEIANYKNSIKEFKEKLRNFKKIPQMSKVNNPYIEYALTEYFNEYLKQINDISTTGIVPNSYSILTSINATQGNTNKNEYYENNLLEEIKQEQKYFIKEQNNKSTGECVFYHIKSMNYQMPDFKNMIRIYLNCKDENVANLVQQLLENNTNPNYYLKFDSTNSMNKMARSEKIVIYSDELHLNEDIQNIMNVKEMNPQLFVDSEKMNPFMQQYGDIFAVSRQPVTNNFVDQNGYSSKIPQSTNAFIANVIQSSYTQTVRDIALKDPKLEFLLEDKNVNDYNLYILNYPYINSLYHEDLINNMEDYMAMLSDKNDVFINGISNNIPEQNRTDNQNNIDDEHSL